MNNSISTDYQAEFSAIFARLEKDHQLTKAAVARALRVERSYVTMLLRGQRTPHLRILESMRELEQRLAVGHENQRVAPETESELNRVIEQLRALERADRPKFEVARQVVASLAESSSTSEKAAAKLLKSAAASVIKSH